MGGRTLSEHLAPCRLQLGVGRVERVDGGGAGEEDHLGTPQPSAFVGLSDRLPAACDLEHPEQIGAVPAQLPGNGLGEERTRLGFQPLGHHDDRLQRAEAVHPQDRRGGRHSLRLLEHGPCDGDRRDLGARDLLPRLHGLAVHQREDADRGQLVEGLDSRPLDSQQPPNLGFDADLALHRALQPGSRAPDGAPEPPGRLVLVDVTLVELDHVHLGDGEQGVKVLRAEHRALTKGRPQVVSEYATGHRGRPDLLSSQAQSPHARAVG
jgi:hypothetical protein